MKPQKYLYDNPLQTKNLNKLHALYCGVLEDRLGVNEELLGWLIWHSLARFGKQIEYEVFIRYENEIVVTPTMNVTSYISDSTIG